MTATTAFAGFLPAAFAFFEELRDNNDPAWFKPRKAVYEDAVLAPFRNLIVAVGAALDVAGLPLVGDPQRGIFRIYRDVRFSPDKHLYKTHAGAVLTRSGSKRDPGLLYLHVEPGASMVAAGFWHPDPALLHRLRRAILDDPDRFPCDRRTPGRGRVPDFKRRAAEPPAARLRGGQGHRCRRTCRLEIVHLPCRAERRRDAVGGSRGPHRRFRPHGLAVSRMGLGGGRSAGAGSSADPHAEATPAQTRLLAVMDGFRRVIRADRPRPRPEEFLELSVDRIGAQGDGIAQLGGASVFLPFTAPGDRRPRPARCLRQSGREGRIVERLVAGPGRADPPCPHFGTRGGRALQHLDPISYRGSKLGARRIALERVRLDPGVVGPLGAVPPARRRARLGILRPRDPLAPVRVGYRERFRHELVDLRDCAVLEPALFDLIARLRHG